MFGIKKLKKQMESIEEGLSQLVHYNKEREQETGTKLKRIEEALGHQKLELSKINTRFHDLGDKIDKTQSHIDKLAEYGIKLSCVDDKLIQKLVADDALLIHIKEFVEKQNVIFEYMKGLEKVMCNVELIIDQCLPEKTLKLPKKKKATIDRF